MTARTKRRRPRIAGHDAPPGLLALALGSVGVVYGDIGTSPLYAFREAAIAASGDQVVSRGVVLGVLSLIVWALIITVTLKYVLILLRADNNGEGGTLSLTALATRALGRRTAFVFIVGVIGASMFLGDSVITPAISVLSAVEGLKLASPAFSEFVVPLTVIILIALFAAQSRGTAKVAAMFGPIMVVWFLSIAIAGGLHIRDDPTVLYAINPFYGVDFLLHHGAIGLVTLGAVFLVVTGGEALYADLGHFGRKPIQTAWLGLVLPVAADQLFRPRRQGTGRPFGDREPVLQAGSRNLPVADGRAGDGGNCHRESGGYHRSVFTCASGDPAWPVAAAHHLAHLGLTCWPNLHSPRHDLADDRRAPSCRSVPHFERARFRLWYCGCNDDGRGRDSCLCRDLEGMAVVALANSCC